MISHAEYLHRQQELLRHAHGHTYGYCSPQGHPMVAFVERVKAARSLAAKDWMEVTDAEVIEYAKAKWKPHPNQELLVTCDPNDPSCVDVICVVLPQI